MGDGLKRARAAARRTREPFIPGFVKADEARRAGESFFAKTDGKHGAEGVDFHLTQNAHGRWHFEPGEVARFV